MLTSLDEIKNEVENGWDICERQFIATVSSSSRSRNLRTQDLACLPFHIAFRIC